MRTREEIEKDTAVMQDSYYTDHHTTVPGYNSTLQVELLLDIRQLLVQQNELLERNNALLEQSLTAKPLTPKKRP